MKSPRRHTIADGSGKAIPFVPRLEQIAVEYARLNTREARVAFVDTMLKSYSYQFQHSWPIIYQVLEWVEAEKLYQDPRVVNAGEVYPDFKSYFEARLRKPFTMWMELEQTHRYVSKYAPDLIEKTFAEAKAKAAAHAQAIDAQDRAEQRPAHRPKTVNNESDVVNTSRPVGNSAAAALRRLRKDRPDIHARVLTGELSPHAGMVEAGFRKKIERRKLSVLERVTKLVPKLTNAEWQHLKRREDARRAPPSAPTKRQLKLV